MNRVLFSHLITSLSSALMLTCTVSAQDDHTSELRFTFSAPLQEHLEKAIYENVRGLDPACTILIDRAAGQLDVFSRSSLPPEAFTEALASVAGLVVSNTVHLNANEDPLTGMQAIPGAPRYVETGDETGDDLRYQEAKNAWIIAHADAYRSLHPQTNAND